MLIYAGVTIVQYRDKTSDTAVQVETARKLHSITQKYGVPLLINDRVDVAVAIDAEGVHLGQDDMSTHLIKCFSDRMTDSVGVAEAKKILPNNAIIGVSASSIDEAKKAIAEGTDYLGVGTMFATPT